MPKSVIVLLLIVSAVLLAACDEDDPTPSPFTPSATEAPTEAVSADATALPTDSSDCILMDNPAVPFVPPSSETVGETLICGTLDLPQDPTDPDGARHQLAYIILLSPAANAASDPVIFLAGGPGTSAILSSADWIASPLRQTRDLILVDQRGTGYSTPSLDCDAYGLTDTDETACLAAITAAGAELGLYNTANSADDIAALMADLSAERGYTTYNLYGVSYGTRLALTLMRDYPSLLRSAVLDSVYPPQASNPVELAVNTDHALNALFAACAANTDCNEAYPTLGEDFDEMVAFLNEVPINDTYTGRNFIADVYAALSDTGILPAIPAGIAAMFAQDFELAFDLLYTGPEGYDPQADLVALYSDVDDETLINFFTVAEGISESQGTFLVFECQEENFFNSLEEAERFTAAAAIDPLVAEARLDDSAVIFDQCDGWFAQGAPASEDDPISSDVPILLLAGELDPITPPNWAAQAAETLTNSTVITIPLATHAVYSAGECPIGIAATFLDDPATAPDSSCINDMTLDFEIYVVE